MHAQELTVEWAPFVKASNVSDEQLIAMASMVNHEFLSKQNGFIKRELIKKSDNEYADLIYWKTKANAVLAEEKVNSCTQCIEYFQLMDMEKNASEGFSHYTIIKSWAH